MSDKIYTYRNHDNPAEPVAPNQPEVQDIEDVLSMATVPGVNEDDAHGFGVGRFIMSRSNNQLYVCTDATTGAAVWVSMAQPSGLPFTLDTQANVAVTPSEAEIVNGILEHSPAAPRTVTTPAAADIIASLPKAVVGTTFRYIIRNAGASTSTLTAAAGVTLVGSAVVYGGQTGEWLAYCSNVTGGAEAITFYRLADVVCSTEAEVDALIAAGTIGEDRLAVQVTPRVLANVADGATVGQMPIVYRKSVAGGATENVVIDRKVRVIDAYCIMQGAGSGGGSENVQVSNGANSITDAVDVKEKADNDIVRFTQIQHANWEIAAAGQLRMAKYAGAAGVEFVVTCLPIA